MGKYVILLVILLQIFGMGADITEEGFGLGIIIGEPTGISFKSWMKENVAIDGAVAWSFEGEDAFHIHADYLFHNSRWIKVDEGKLFIYYGIGARLKLQDRSRLGVRIPLGASYIVKDTPLEFFLEIVPIMDLVPDTELEGNGGFGARWYF